MENIERVDNFLDGWSEKEAKIVYGGDRLTILRGWMRSISSNKMPFVRQQNFILRR